MICNFIALRSQNKLFDLICSCLQKTPQRKLHIFQIAIKFLFIEKVDKYLIVNSDKYFDWILKQ